VKKKRDLLNTAAVSLRLGEEEDQNLQEKPATLASVRFFYQKDFFLIGS
jgi:hypothetical protein